MIIISLIIILTIISVERPSCIRIIFYCKIVSFLITTALVHLAYSFKQVVILKCMTNNFTLIKVDFIWNNQQAIGLKTMIFFIIKLALKYGPHQPLMYS